MFPQNNLVGGPTDIFGTHDLISIALFKNAILVNPGLVGESIGADDRLVRLDGEPGNARDHPTGRKNLGGINGGVA